MSGGPSGASRPVSVDLCAGFTRGEWELPVPDGLTRVLLGWRVVPPRAEPGVPGGVADLLATALCRHATLTFPTALPDARRRGLFAQGWRQGRDFVWKSTQDLGEAVAGIFHSDVFSWHLHGQTVVLSRPGTAPALNADHLEVSARPELLGDLRRLGATGLLLPGVGGAVAGLYTFAAADMDDIIGTLSQVTREAGGDCVTRDEAELVAATNDVDFSAGETNLPAR